MNEGKKKYERILKVRERSQRKTCSKGSEVRRELLFKDGGDEL